MRASYLQTIIQQAAEPLCIWQSICQRGNRIIVIDTFFAIPFSDLFRLKINSNFLPIDLLTNVTFKLRKRLLNERIRDHVTHLRRMFCVSELSPAHLRDIRFHWRI